MVEFKGYMDTPEEATIEDATLHVESEEPLTDEKVKTLKVSEMKVELQRGDLSKNGRKDVLFNQILEAVVTNLPIINDGVESNGSGGMQDKFPNPEELMDPSFEV